MSEVFPIIPASGKIFWLLGPLGLLLLVLVGLFGYIAYSSQHVEFVVSPDGLRIRGEIYGRLVPAASLLASNSKSIDLRCESEYRPRIRTNGVGLPGYWSGWFRLRNREKALLFVTDFSRVVYIPKRDGYAVMLIVANVEGFLQSIRRIAN